MNNLKTTALGGMPYNLDDMRWVDAGVREAFKGIMSAFNINLNETFILSGCERIVASATVTITQGYVSFGGEICFVPEHSYATPVGQIEYWDLVVTFDPAGDKVFQSPAALVQTYEVRTAKIALANPVPAGYTRYGDSKNIFNIIRRKINTDTWKSLAISIIGNALPLPAPPGYLTLNYKKDSAECVHFSGVVFIGLFATGSLNHTIATLPVGYRPLTDHFFVLAINTDESTGQINFLTGVIKVDGKIRINTSDHQSSSTPWRYYDLSQITTFEAVV